MIARFFDRLAVRLCRLLHGRHYTLPYGGAYRCRKCQRRYAVPWAVAVDPETYNLWQQ